MVLNAVYVTRAYTIYFYGDFVSKQVVPANNVLYLPSSLGSYNISLLGNDVLRTGILSPVNTDSLNIA